LGTVQQVFNGGNWYMTPTSSFGAIVNCPLPTMIVGTPWDTAVLTRISYSHPPAATQALQCSIQAVQGGVVIIQSPWMFSTLNSPSHVDPATGWHYTIGNGWMRAGNPNAPTYRLRCVIPANIKFVNYTFVYEDRI
jgi:hypothetical protein